MKLDIENEPCKAGAIVGAIAFTIVLTLLAATIGLNEVYTLMVGAQ